MLMAETDHHAPPAPHPPLTADQQQQAMTELPVELRSAYALGDPISMPLFGYGWIRVPVSEVGARVARYSSGLVSDPTFAAVVHAEDGGATQLVRVERFGVAAEQMEAHLATLPSALFYPLRDAIIDGLGQEGAANLRHVSQSTISRSVREALLRLNKRLYGARWAELLTACIK